MPRVTSARLYPRGPVLYADIRLDAEPWRIQRSTGFRVGQDPEARAALEEAIREIEKGSAADFAPGAWTVRRWGEKWTDERRAAGKVLSWVEEKAHLSLHLYPSLGNRPLREVTKPDMLAWIRELPKHPTSGNKAKPGETISPRTVHNISNTVRAMFRAAAKRDLIDFTPCVWDASDLPHRDERRDHARLEGGFDLEQVATILADPRIPQDRRVLYAIEFLTGMRTGEAAVRRWRDWKPDEKPLGMLVGATAWSSRHRIEKATKTRSRKLCPVHPFLARALADWKARGWRRLYGRTPTPDDLIVPGVLGGPRHSAFSGKRFKDDLRAVEIDAQIHYETRSTFRSLALAAGADLAALDLITHPTPKQAAELYTRRRLLWPRMCAAVEGIRLSRQRRVRAARTLSR